MGDMETPTYYISWEHEYFTDDDATTRDSKEDAEALAAKLREMGKRRIRIDGPGYDADEDDEF